jgi:hypothetical protein
VSDDCGADAGEVGTCGSGRGPSARGMVERSRSIAAAETSTEEGEVEAAAGRISRAGASGLNRGGIGSVGGAARGAGAAAGLAETPAVAGLKASEERCAPCTETFIASPSRPSSLTTADNPIRTKPPTSAVEPPEISAAPKLNSLSGIPKPNPIAATPHAATAIPKTNSTIAISPTPRPVRTHRGSPPLWLPINFGSVRLYPQRLMWRAPGQLRICLTKGGKKS